MNLQFPTLVTRSVKGAPLSDAEMDANLTNIKAYCLTLANLITSSLNPDGTLTAGSVGSTALQSAAVTLASLNPALLYSLVPVDTDTGTLNAYAITAKGGKGGNNVVPAGATYDANGNYVVAGLTPNYGYFWQPGPAHDISCAPVNQTAITATGGGSFTAVSNSVTLTGTPLAAVTASVYQAAPINAYKNGQIFFVYTTNANTAAATFDVNNLGAIPILQNGLPLPGGAIPANSIFAVCYQNGAFILFSAGTAASQTASDSSIQYTLNNTVSFATGNVNLPGAGLNYQAAHGLSQNPSSVRVLLTKIAADATAAGIGESFEVTQFTQTATVAPAFTVGFDATNVYVTQANDIPSLGGVTITPASWQMSLRATVTNAASNVAMPALTYCLAKPDGAFCYGNTLVAFGSNPPGTIVLGYAINLTNNRVSALSAANVGVPQKQNHSPWTRTNGVGYSVFTSTSGLYEIPLSNPNINIVPVALLYSNAGVKQITSFVTGTAYTLTKGANDTAYSIDGGNTYIAFPTNNPSTVAIPAGNNYPSLYLKGNANSTVTATLVGSVAWQPLQLSTSGASYMKPVWMTEAGGAPNMVYVVSSNSEANTPLNAVQMQAINCTTNAVAAIGTPFDFTNATIGNIAVFNAFYPAGDNSTVLFFQYNPFTQRIYLQTNKTGLLHIFQISATLTNDISAFWTNANRYQNLTYLKTIAIGGADAFSGSDAWHYGRRNLTIEIDQTTGLEKSIVITNEGDVGLTGSVLRIPWLE